MSNSQTRHLQILEILPTPVRAALRDDADLSEWPELLVHTMEKSWGNHQHATSLDEIPAAEVLLCQRFLDVVTVQDLEQRAATEMLSTLEPLTQKLIEDPWKLDHPERCQLMAAMRSQQYSWISRLRDLVEPPRLDDWFPAFLLETPPFAELRAGIGEGACRGDLDTAVADGAARFPRGTPLLQNCVLLRVVPGPFRFRPGFRSRVLRSHSRS